MSAELFLELGSEDIPARFVAPALAALAAGLDKLLGPVPHGAVRTWGTPRRLAVAVSDVALSRPTQERVITGPPAAQAWKDGAPTPVALAFAKAKGIEPSALFLQETPKGPVLAARVQEGGESTATILARGLDALVAGLPFKKTMRWGTGTVRYARPLHRVTCVLGGALVPATVLGLETVDSSVGHWLLAPDAFVVRSAAQWLEELRARFVIADVAERRATIAAQLAEAAAAVGAEVPPDEALLDEVTQLVELPTTLVGAFPEALLELPPRLLVESMKVNQRYFPLFAHGRLSNRFLVVTNNPHGDGPLIAAGNARVLAARFHDARFFYQEDRRKRLVEHGEKLTGMTWIRGLGTMAERQARIGAVAAALAPGFGADHAAVAVAAARCKSDLATLMVGEFPELQGHVGRLLAELEGEGAEAALAIEEHYLPRGQGDGLPTTAAGATLAVADRVLLVGSAFAHPDLGLVPKGNADPQGIRRAAGGLVAILLDRGWKGGLDELFRRAGFTAGVEGAVEFVLARFRAQLLAEGHAADLVDAVMAVGGTELVAMAARVRGVSELVRDGRFGPIRVTFRRVAGLVKEHTDASYRLDLFEGEPEYQLHLAQSHLPAADAPVAELLGALAELRPVVDRFFDGVLVMTEDLPLRNNRLGLLRSIVNRFASFADFSRLSSDTTSA